MGKSGKSFADKVKKLEGARSDTRQVMVIRSIPDPRTGVIKFSERMEAVVDDGKLDENLVKLVQGKN